MGRVFLLICCLALSLFSFSQSCEFEIRGQIKDKGDYSPLSFATIQLLGNDKTGVVADVEGKFSFQNICAGQYHLQVNYQGYRENKIYLEIFSDTTLIIKVEPHAELLNEVIVHGQQEVPKTQISHVIGEHIVHEQSSKNLANILSETTGVNIIKNGSGVAKPIIHGMYGNRLTILNAGLVQSGQQWGNDHDPEIDPFVANHLSVIKGSAALEFGGNSLGGVILIEEGKIEDDPHLHGETNYIFETNGRGHTTNLMFEQGNSNLKWKATGTYKNYGDGKTPDYFLTNTGRRERNFSVLLEKNIFKWNSKTYYSHFNKDLGILAGAQVGSEADLEIAFKRKIPFLTKTYFSREITPPSQKVRHHLLKFETKRKFNKNDWEFTGGYQQNHRREFDNRRGKRSEKPTLELKLNTLELKVKHTYHFTEKTQLKSGIHYIFKDNTNISGTGVSPLIPNYRAWKTGAFSVYQKDFDKSFYEIGARYDFFASKVYALEGPLRKTVVYYNHDFHNFSINGGYQYQFNNFLKLTTNLGLITRAPEINELHSNGLHQGVSSLEYGDSKLTPENAIKLLSSIEYSKHKKITFQALGYYQLINNYIFLQPEAKRRTTIRGSFFVYNYETTPLARIGGLDATLICHFSPKIQVKATYSMLRGEDLKNNNPLIFMPSDKITTKFKFKLPEIVFLKRSEFNFGATHIAKQNRLSDSEANVPPAPNGYFVLDAGFKTNISIKEINLKFTLNVENLLNTKYRDYLNRLRFFSDENGRSFNFGINILF